MFYTATVREMFCKNCGSQLPDGTKFCTACGQKLEAEVIQPVEAPSAETVVLTPEARPTAFEQPAAYAQPTAFEQPAAYAQPTAQPAEFAQPWQTAPVAEPPKKKKKNLLGLLIPVIALVVVAAVAAVLLIGPLKGWRLKTFGDAAEYRDYVQTNTTQLATSTITKAYGAAVTTLSGEAKAGGAADVTMKINVGDKAVGLLEDLTKAELGQEISMDWAKDVQLKLSGNAKDDLQQIGAALNIGSHEIAVLDCILNLNEGQLFVAILNLSDEYLAVDISEYLYDMEDATAMMELLQDPELIAALLPLLSQVVTM